MANCLFVVFNTLLVSFLAFSPQIFIIWPWYGRVLSIELLQLLVPFNILVGLLFWNYSLCITTDPGGVPTSWVPASLLNDVDRYKVNGLTGRGSSYCYMCNHYKPPRTHHCKQCKRCILRMDHHCPLVNNCVGHYNYGHFIRFLFYVDLALTYQVGMLTWCLMTDNTFWDPSGEVLFLLNYCISLPILLIVGIFSLYHFNSVLTNTTTIEEWEKEDVAKLVTEGKIREMAYPYNLGIRRNIHSVLGPNPLMWCCPTVTPGNGLEYPLADGNGPIYSEWPPNLDDPEAVVSDDEERNHPFEPPSSPYAKLHGSYTSVPGPPYHPDYRHEDRGHDRYSASSESEEEDDQLNRPRLCEVFRVTEL